MQHDYFYTEYSRQVHGSFKEGLKQAHIHGLCYGLAQSMIFFISAASFRFGAYEVGCGEMTPNDVYRWASALNDDEMMCSVYFLINFSLTAIGYTSSFFPEYAKARFSAGIIFKMMQEEPLVDQCEAGGKKPVCIWASNCENMLIWVNRWLCSL